MPLCIPVSYEKIDFCVTCMYSPTTAKWLLVQFAVIPILLNCGSLCAVRIVMSRLALSAQRSTLPTVFSMRTV
jgi:hypothetical protein